MKVKQRRLNGWRRLFLMPLLLPTVLPLVLAASLVTYAASPVQSPLLVGPKQHYLSLGDGNAVGFQPNGDLTHGYVPDLFQILQHEGTKDVTNLACGVKSETTTSFINGNSDCSYYPSSQLKAAVDFLHANAGKVSPVTLSIGGNDVQFDINPITCQVDEQKFSQDLATLDSNLKVILLALQQALTVKGHVTGSIVLMNLWDPFQNICPNSVPFVQTTNQHLANDISGFGVIADVFTAFGGPNTPNPNLCTYTWMCAPSPLGPDGHATTIGYQVIANTFAAVIPKN